MPITMSESFESRERTVNKQGGAELRYIVKGSSNDQDVLDYALANLPSTYASMPRQEVRLRALGPDSWEVMAHYAPNSATSQAQVDPVPPPEPGDKLHSWDTTGGTQHITQALATVSSHAPSGLTAPDFKGAINVTEDGVAGVDVTVRELVQQWTIVKTDAEVATIDDYLYDLTGKVNNGSFYGYAAGECLFLGATGEQRIAGGDWTITLKVAIQPNSASLTVGDITIASKKGWDHLWVLYEHTEDATAKKLVQRPRAAYVVQVYEYGDFTTLGTLIA